ncbi:hypothetical protein BDR06DRAFT_978637 [Suillus hirtellus]|nr:hypothetical protein BDR06DRAFT_978637 [Suillus hirtellus]
MDLPGVTNAPTLDGEHVNLANPFQEQYRWHQLTVKIWLPKEKEKFQSENDAPELKILGVHHHCLTDLITQVFENEVSRTFNMTPFQQYWKTPNDPYTEINALPQEPGDELECVVASVMVWSDATHLANFRDASLWPFYVYFGNQSKYTQGKPTAWVCHHLAYIPTLPKNIQEIYMDIFGKATTADVHTHLKWELMHTIWSLILDGKFMEAYEHGLLMILLVTIKFLGCCPCPHCLVKKTDVHKLGMKLNMKRVPVDGACIKAILNDESYVPICNAFSEQFRKHTRFNMFKLWVVNQLHKSKIGSWKALFTHLMQILHAAWGTAIQKLNEWRGTICHFHTNASTMKKLTACDFKDLLQCTIPVFEGLLPKEHDVIVLDMLFDLATWHGYARLHMHTDNTLDFLDTATMALGQSV